MEIILKRNERILTDNLNKSYEIKKGVVTLYLVSYQADNTRGRKYWIADLEQGIQIPSFSIKENHECTWFFELDTLDQVLLEERVGLSDESIVTFAKRIGIDLLDPQFFTEEVLELINMKKITEEGYIYASYKEQQKIYEKGLHLIYRVFHKDKRNVHFEKSGNGLYDTVSFLCDKQKIKIVSYDEMKEGCGRKFTIEDISRISQFSIRKIILDEKWYLHDSGAFLAFTKENIPVACIPKGSKKYEVFNLNDNSVITMNKETADMLLPSAYMLYRPFPNKKMNLKSLIQFGFQGLNHKDLINMLLFSLIGTLIGLLLPYLTQIIYDEYITMGDEKSLVSICLLVLSFTLGNLVFSIIKNLALFRTSNSMAYEVQSAMLDRLYNLPSQFIQQFESADLVRRALGMTTIFKLFSQVIVTTFLSAIFSILYLFWMFRYSVLLSAAGILMVFINMAITAVIGKIQVSYETSLLEKETTVSSKLFQIITNISKIRIAGVEDRALIQYLEPYVEAKDIYRKKENLSNIAKVINIVFGCTFTMFFYYLLIHESIPISYGGFLAFLSSFGMFSKAMIDLVVAFLDVNHVIPIYKRAKAILETTKEVDDDVIIPGKIRGSLEVNNVSFAYAGGESNVLNHLSFKINEGEYIGIVGSSGSGKSTLLKLLLGFEKPQIGKIYYDDMDIDRLDKRELRKRCGVVLQDGQLIGGSIYDNISIASPNTVLKKVNEAVENVGLADDIAQMPMGLHTVVSEGGGTISGGQRQRILIARAIMNKPKMLFFDEATSALDNVNQNLVCKNLEKLKATRIVIAHRLSTIIDCDRILVMDKGTIVEQGAYEELMNQKGKFYDLVQRQM